MVHERQIRDTLTAVEMDVGDELRFVAGDGRARSIVLRQTGASVDHTTLKQLGEPEPGAMTRFRFHAVFEIDGQRLTLEREAPTARSFYEPTEVAGLWLWLDAVDDIFGFLREAHGQCRPRRRARLAVHESGRRICPVLLHPWCPLPAGGLRIADAYRGEDVWLGAYDGADAHGGLDINHPAGTPIWTPIPIDDHWLFNSLEQGHNNNRWRGFHTWPDGSTWVLQVHHVIRLLHDEHQPLPAGTQLADGAGVWVGALDHSHFVFRVVEPGQSQDDAIMLDPWILFWQMYRDRELTTAP